MIRRIYLIYLFSAVCLVTVGSLPGNMQPRVAHELQDGFVERAVAVVIRDQKATLNYYFGVNDPTLDKLLDELQGTQRASQMSDCPDPALTESANSRHTLLLAKLSAGLDIRCGGKSLKLRPVKIVISPKHHFSYLAEFAFEFPTEGTHELEICDANFQEMESGVRYSLKATGSTMITQSNVAPIIIRASRHELHKLQPEQRAEACKIRATLAIQIDESS